MTKHCEIFLVTNIITHVRQTRKWWHQSNYRLSSMEKGHTSGENYTPSIIHNISRVIKIKKEVRSEFLTSKKTLCLTMPDYRTFIDDYLKILDFIDWLKVAYPEKAAFLTKK